MNEFQFANPAYLFGLVLIVVFLLSNYTRRKRPTFLYSDTRLANAAPKTWRVRGFILTERLRFIAWGLLIVALARPQIGNAEEIIQGEGIDIALALDISPSMSCPDLIPNRLEAAKQVITQFISQREFDRIGLVVFSSNAYYQAPPTLDYDTLISLVADVKLASDLGLEGKTAIGIGIASAANLLRQSTSPSKIIILLTDGANNAGLLDPITAAEAIHTLGIRVYTIGVGQNNVDYCENDLDEDLLRQIAEIAEGTYFRADTKEDLARIYEQINRLERSTSQRNLFIRWQDIADFFIFSAFLVLIIERILNVTIFDTLP